MEGVKKRSREEVDEEAVMEEMKKMRYDIFDTLDDVEVEVELDLEVSDLASVMKSFEEEIGVVVVEEEEEGVKDVVTSEIGWLLEASDDELGLPTIGVVKENGELSLPPCATEVVADEGGLGIQPWEFGGDGELAGFDVMFGYEDTASPLGFGGFS